MLNGGDIYIGNKTLYIATQEIRAVRICWRAVLKSMKRLYRLALIWGLCVVNSSYDT